MATQTIKDGPKDYFKIHKNILKICGISFNPNEGIAYRLYANTLLLFVILGYPILDTLELFKHDFDTSSGIVMYQAGTIINAAKAISLLINRVKIGKFLAKLEEEPFLPNPNRGGDKEEILIRECIWKTNLQTHLYGGSIAGSIIVPTLYALSTRLRSDDYHKWLLPFGPLTILDVTYSPNYVISLVYQTLSVLVFAGVLVSNDLIIAGVLIHISYQFKVLQNYLRNIVAFSRKDVLKVNDNFLQEEEASGSTIAQNHRIDLQNSIKKAIQYHVAILDLAKELEELFRYMLLVAFLGTMGILCFEIYQFSLFQNVSSGMLRHLIEYISGSFPILGICYWGEEILFQSVEVGNAAFEADFVGTDLTFQKALVMIIRRSQQPVKLTAGKFADICLATCLWVWKTSYTVCMVLRNTNQK